MDFVSLWRRAAVVFHGRCLERREVRDGEPVPYTEYVFEVIEASKGLRDPSGRVLEKVTFRHAGTRTGKLRPDGLEEAPLRLGLPEYEPGQEAVLFLTRESRVGLCAPVGLDQGRFVVERKDGKPFVKNPRGAALFRAVGVSSFRSLGAGELAVIEAGSKPIDLKSFLGLCAKVKEP
jgi:hypothetical protein